MKEGHNNLITYDEVEKALKATKANKAAGPSGVVAEMLKAAGETGTALLTDLCNAILVEERIPTDWNNSTLVPVFKGKGDALECSSYRAIKLLEHAMKVLERVLEKKIRNQAQIHSMQF